MQRITLPLYIFATFFLVAWAAPAAAQSGETGNVCVRDFQGGAVCTANDVRIEALNPVTVLEDCESGTVGETEVVFETLVSAAGSPDRFDIGLFLALDGGSARDGDNCFHDFLEPPLTATPTLGDSNMDGVQDIDGGPWLDNDGDSCGDIGTNTQVIKPLQPLRFSCVDSNLDGSVDVSVCTSWDNNAGTVCNDLSGAFPGTNSKCSCDTVELGITPVHLTVTKSPASQTVQSGGTASFMIVAESTGVEDIQNVVISDPQCDTLTGPTGDDGDGILETTETWSWSCTIDNVTADFTNTATVTGQAVTSGASVSEEDTADVLVTDASMVVSKTPATQSILAGSDANFTITAENTGTADLTSVMISDPLCDTLTGPAGDDGDGILEPAETWSWSCTVNNVTADFTNTATVTATPPTGPDVSDTDTADVTVEGPGVLVTKSPATQNVVSGGDATFTITAENTGNVNLTGVVADDPLCDTLTGPAGDDGDGILEPAETWSWSCTVNNVTADFTNTATVTATPPTGPDVSDTDTADVTVTNLLPEISASKSDTLSADANGDGLVGPGDTLLYEVVIQTSNAADATAVVFTDTPDPNTTLVVGSVTTTQGVVTMGNGMGDTQVSVDIGTLVAGGSVTVTFEVMLPDPLPEGVTTILNQGLVSSSELSDVSTDDPTTGSMDDPTTTPVGSVIVPIPTLGFWSLLILVGLLVAAGLRMIRL